MFSLFFFVECFEGRNLFVGSVMWTSVSRVIRSRGCYDANRAKGVHVFRFLTPMGVPGLQVLPGELSCQFFRRCSSSNSLLLFKGKCSGVRWSKDLRTVTSSSKLCAVQDFYGLHRGEKPKLLRCYCQPAERGNERIFDDEQGRSVHSIAPNGQTSDAAQQFKNDNGAVPSSKGLNTSATVNNALPKSSTNSIEEEAWDLLRASMVYYCGNPIGTIAANDPSDSSILNYDQVFIRDFIPSGIAFLLKGEYDIVRNFLLHTLQLQVKELSYSLT